MANTRNALDLPSDNRALKSVGRVSPIEVYAAGDIVDGNGDRIPTRVVFRIKGTKKFFFLFAKGTEEDMRTPAPWLQKELERMIDGESGAGDAAPDDMNKSIPVGNSIE
jgi:hypothetical protein